jgi:hypothetical protein
VYVVSEATAGQRLREEYAPAAPERTSDEALDVLSRAMRRREAESLAIEVVEPEYLPAAHTSAAPVLPLPELAEAGAEHAMAHVQQVLGSGVRTPGRETCPAERQHGTTREL